MIGEKVNKTLAMIYLNNLFITLSIVLLFTCNNKSINPPANQLPLNSQAIQVNLIDSLGSINLSIPLRYDTSFSWVNYSDCGKPCDIQSYRFQPRSLPVTKESGFMWVGEHKDLVERFTISHSRDFPFRDGDTSKNIWNHNLLKKRLTEGSQNRQILFDTIQKVNDSIIQLL